MSIAFSEEDIYYLSAGTEVKKRRTIIRGNTEIIRWTDKISVMDLKETLKTLPLPENDRYFDASVAAYLLNYIEKRLSMGGFGKDYAGLMIPSKNRPLRKRKSGQGKQAKPEAFLKYICYMAYIPEDQR